MITSIMPKTALVSLALCALTGLFSCGEKEGGQESHFIYFSPTEPYARIDAVDFRADRSQIVVDAVVEDVEFVQTRPAKAVHEDGHFVTGSDGKIPKNRFQPRRSNMRYAPKTRPSNIRSASPCRKRATRWPG